MRKLSKLMKVEKLKKLNKRHQKEPQEKEPQLELEFLDKQQKMKMATKLLKKLKQMIKLQHYRQELMLLDSQYIKSVNLFLKHIEENLLSTFRKTMQNTLIVKRSKQ